jgi:two-component system sensor histidine kinase RegB
LRRIVQNLLENALEAARRSVTLHVHADVAGLRVVLHDDGPGIPPDVLERVGEPFYSTKGPGSGLGLGVFIARSLAEQMGGRVALESSPGIGTTARVEVPTALAAGGGPVAG